jgi:hypothetical protein
MELTTAPVEFMSSRSTARARPHDVEHAAGLSTLPV